MRKKIKKSIKHQKLENKKKTNREKKPIRIFKKPIGSVRLHKPETEKPNQNQTKINIKTEPKKPSQIEKNRNQTH